MKTHPAKKVLIVDDDQEIRNVLRIILESLGHVCESAVDGAQALEMIGKSAYDAVVTDINMPNMDGITLIRELAARHPGLPVMVMTGFLQEYNEKDVLDAGAADFITKPFSLTEFSARFHKMMSDRNRPAQPAGNAARVASLLSTLTSETGAEAEAIKREIENLKDLAYFDSLTGLPNRVLFEDRLMQSLTMAKRYSHLHALLFLDLDKFKPINDDFGHDAGDQVLREVAARLAACVRKSDTVARLGGDEFSIILARIIEERDAAVVSRRIISSLEEPFQVRGETCTVGVSIGISLFPIDGEDRDTLMTKADNAMYRAKEEQGNSYRF